VIDQLKHRHELTDEERRACVDKTLKAVQRMATELQQETGVCGICLFNLIVTMAQILLREAENNATTPH
jgi:hypothetical protein